jgi:hypothetical protein
MTGRPCVDDPAATADRRIELTKEGRAVVATSTGSGGGNGRRTLRPPARSRLLRVYGTLLPLRVRLAIKARLSPELHAYLTRRATNAGPAAQVVDAVQSFVARRRDASFLGRPDHVLAHSVHGLAVATVTPGCTPLVARRANLETTLDILAGAGVNAHCVRGFDDLVSVVAVAEVDRPRVLRALSAAAARTPLYVAELVGSRPGPPRRGATRRTWGRLSGVPGLRVARFFTDPTGSLVLGLDSGCDIEFWTEADGQLQAPRPNRVADVVPVEGDPVPISESDFTRLASRSTAGLRTYPGRPEMTGRLLDEIDFPIDLVYTWVDGSDPAWRARRDQALGGNVEALNRQSANDSRFISRDELRYSFRSVAMFAPWVRRIFLVTDDQVPAWLDPTHPQITVVSHKELFGDRGALPTFNSHAIESQLHRIEGLSEHFIYLNDDVFLGRPCLPQMFFQANGVSKVFLSRAKIDPGPVDVESDIPSTAAGKNNRRLVLDAFDRRVTFKMKHVPHALRRSVLQEIEQRYPAEVGRTAGHRFRHPEDISLTSSLYQYYSFLSGRAVIDNIAYMYVDLSARHTPSMLRLALAKRNFDVFCVNDTDSDPSALQRQHQLMHEFLSAYFPIVAPWERDNADRLPPPSAAVTSNRPLVDPAALPPRS